MSTLLNADLASDTESDDEEFQLENRNASSSEDEEEDDNDATNGEGVAASKGVRRKALKTPKAARAAKQKADRLKQQTAQAERIDKLFAELKNESRQSFLDFHCTIAQDDVLIPYQKKAIKPPKHLPDAKDLISHINRATSKIIDAEVPAATTGFDTSQACDSSQCTLDIPAFKQRCRQVNSELELAVKQAISQAEESSSELTIKQRVRFAGQEFEIEKKLQGKALEVYNSRAQRNQDLGGQFSGLDSVVKSLETVSTINSVQKSGADWEQFKKQTGITQELQKGHGYLERKRFLSEAEWAIHEQNVQARRKMQEKQ